MTSAYAPFNTSYSQRTPYLTTTEFLNAPTAVDVSNLLSGPNTTYGQQTSVLSEVIGRASAEIDNYCCGAWGTLCATVNTENARAWSNNLGQLIIHPKYWPILEVRTFSYGPTYLTAASVDPSACVGIEPQQFIVEPGSSNQFFGTSSLGGFTPGTQYACEWTYVNGWPNTTLAASVAAGAASVTVATATGIYPGTNLSIYDVPDDETVQVASNYTIGSTTVPLVSPLNFQHLAGVSITNLPASVKQAAIMVASYLVKQRGSGSVTVPSVGSLIPEASQHGSLEAADDLLYAQELIDPFRMIFVGY